MTSMRDLFPEWHHPSEEEIRKLHATALIVPDTNVMLSVYKVGRKGADEIFKVFEAHAEQLWFPHQVILEYQRNRLTKIREQEQRFAAIYTAWDNLEKATLGQAREIDGGQEHGSLTQQLTAKLTAAKSQLFNEMETIKANHLHPAENPSREDEYRDRWSQLADGRIGSTPSGEVRSAREKEASDRAAKRIPPGYEDFKKKPEDHAAGDYMIWCEIIDQAITLQRPVIFVTGDVKEDWYDRSGGKTGGPRRELVREMMDRTSQRYWQETFRSLQYHLQGDRVSPETLDRIESQAQEEAAVEDRAPRDGTTELNPRRHEALVAILLDTQTVVEQWNSMHFRGRRELLGNLIESSKAAHAPGVSWRLVEALRNRLERLQDADLRYDALNMAVLRVDAGASAELQQELLRQRRYIEDLVDTIKLEIPGMLAEVLGGRYGRGQ